MICPQCGAEYRPGFLTCADCGIALVPELPDEMAGAKSSGAGDLAALGEFADPSFAADLFEAIDRAGIPYLAQVGTAHAHLEGETLFRRERRGDWQAVVWVPVGSLQQGRALRDDLLHQRRTEASAGTEEESDAAAPEVSSPFRPH